MSQHVDPEEELAESLFEAARREQAPAAARERALAAVSRRPRRRGGPAVAHALVLAAALGGSVLLLRELPVERDAPISAERIVPSATKPRAGEASSPPSTVEPSTMAPPALVPATPSAAVADVTSAPERRKGARPATLQDELALLDRARDALAAGNPKKSLSLLHQYEQTPGARHLAGEATLLRIQSLAESGRRGEAERLAREFIDENRDSVLVDRARRFTRTVESPRGEEKAP